MSRYDTDEDEDEIETPVVEKLSTPAVVPADEIPPVDRPPRESVAPPERADDDKDIPHEQVRRVIKRGWGNAEEVKTSDSPFAQTLKIGSEPQVVKFLEDDPYTSYHQHWIERQGQRSFVCIAKIDPKGCPLCDAGDRASAKFAFNVALMSEDNDPVLKSYEVGVRIIDSLKNFHLDPRQGPLPKNYWAISRTGTKGSSQTNHQMIRERDLREEWEMDPITEDQFGTLKKNAYTESIVTIPTRKTLMGIASEELSA